MTVGFRLLPKRVNVWFATFFDHLRKTCRINFEELHSRMVRPAGGRAEQKSPPENYGKEDQTTVAAFLPWRGL